MKGKKRQQGENKKARQLKALKISFTFFLLLFACLLHKFMFVKEGGETYQGREDKLWFPKDTLYISNIV